MASEQIAFRHGELQHFITTRGFTLGNIGNGQPLTLSKGTDVLFDGTTAEVNGGRYPMPQLRGAFKAGWLIRAASYDEFDTTSERPRSANIQVKHAADGGNPLRPNQSNFARATSEDVDEREVGNVTAHANSIRDRNNGYVPGQRVTGQVIIEPQDGVEVRSGFQTPSGDEANRHALNRAHLTGNNIGGLLHHANNVGQIAPGEGISEEEYLARMSPRQRDEYLAQIEMRRSQYVSEPRPSQPTMLDNGGSRVVGRVQNRGSETREGITASLFTGGGTETADMSGYDQAPARSSVLTQDGMTFRTTNGPRKDVHFSAEASGAPTRVVASLNPSPAVSVKEAPAAVRRMVAKQFCADFPDNYDFTVSPRKKLARLQADYEDRHDVLKAVFAAEGDDMKQMLLSEFPQAFEG
jgi:hypothetical protein